MSDRKVGKKPKDEEYRALTAINPTRTKFSFPERLQSPLSGANLKMYKGGIKYRSEVAVLMSSAIGIPATLCS